MKTFRAKDPAVVEDLVAVLREMGFVAHRSGLSTVDAYLRAPRDARCRISFAKRPLDGPSAAAATAG